MLSFLLFSILARIYTVNNYPRHRNYGFGPLRSEDAHSWLIQDQVTADKAPPGSAFGLVGSPLPSLKGNYTRLASLETNKTGFGAVFLLAPVLHLLSLLHDLVPILEAMTVAKASVEKFRSAQASSDLLSVAHEGDGAAVLVERDGNTTRKGEILAFAPDLEVAVVAEVRAHVFYRGQVERASDADQLEGVLFAAVVADVDAVFFYVRAALADGVGRDFVLAELGVSKF
ncbi:hypothetical protein TsFJ059_000784 [Trichoderma semiorbis]|uniref:Uncharacterized protein n=1 Tax=Trichoderma semiorbis TaxID=1491008 RepID=A0A9P8KXK0_9HYPO|nr:hypothetical protein TsFJ059_000784 [Trichoderma semiorbis]